MFYYLEGKVTEIDMSLVVIDCGGVGFAVNTTANTISRVKKGESARLYTYCNIKEDAFDIYGFASKSEKHSFELLLGVSGVGPKAGLAILSVLSVQKIIFAVSGGDHKALTAANGVGPKLAQRIVLELKDKLGKGFGSSVQLSDIPGAQAAPAGAMQQAAAALTSLGYTGSEAAAALSGLDETLPVSELIRLALQGIGKRR